MKTLLLTGGIGSGKSAVAGILREKGIPVFDSDSETKNLYTPWRIRRIEKILGVKIHAKGGALDKKALSSLVFNNPEALGKLEGYIYPSLLRVFRSWRKTSAAPFVVFESAIALSKPFFSGIWDGVILVDAPLEVRLCRAASRDRTSLDAVRKRAALQEIPQSADYVIVNDSTMEELERRVEDDFLKKIDYIC
ncbi:MAG: dephospho-CoA kinase [Bacteroidales bacterium]|nr:dephospho-CoA kinase [Bacteroidales bacterium]